MATISAISSAPASIAATLAKTRLAQAVRDADQAQATADALRAKADNADRAAQKSQDNVRELAASSRQLDATYDRQLRGAGKDVPLKTQELLADLYSATSPSRAASGTALKTNASASPVVNTQGQATGRIVNVSA